MEQTTLHDVWRALRRGWLWIVICAVLGAAAAVGVRAQWPEEYEATAVLTVDSIAVGSVASSSGAVNMETERVVASSTAVLVGASATLGDVPVTEIRDALTVDVPKDSRVLEFTYIASDPQFAADGANAVARSYSTQRTETAQRVIDETSDSLASRIAQLEQDLNAATPGSATAAAMELQIASLQERQAALTAATFYPGTLVSPAVPPVSTSVPGLRIFVVAGVALGLLLGVVIAVVRHRSRMQAAPVRASAYSEDVSQDDMQPEPGDRPGTSRGADGMSVLIDRTDHQRPNAASEGRRLNGRYSGPPPDDIPSSDSTGSQRGPSRIRLSHPGS